MKIVLQRRFSCLYWPSVTALVGALNLYAPGEPTFSERTLASGLILLSAATIWVWSWDGTLEIAFMPIMIGLSSISYALPIFLLMPGMSFVPFPLGEFEPDIDKALVLTISGLLLILLGYYAPWGKAIGRFLPKVQLEWEDTRAIKIVSWLTGLIGLIAVFAQFHYELPHEIRYPVGLVGEACFLSIASLLFLQLNHQLDWISILFLWCVLLPGRALLGMMSGWFAYGVLGALSVLLTYASVKRRIPWAIVLVGFLALSVLQPAKTAFRREVWSGGTTELNTPDSERFESLTNSVGVGEQVVEVMGPQPVISMAAERMGAPLFAFVKVVQLTPYAVPYWMGESYYPLFFKFIPRAIYPEKPDEVLPNEFGHRYGIIQDPLDYSTAINVPQVVELYGNFGILGVLLGSLLIGIFYRLVSSVFVHPAMGFGGLVAGIFISTNWLLANEGNFSDVNGMLPGQIVVLLIFAAAIRFTSDFLRAIHIRMALHQNALRSAN